MKLPLFKLEEYFARYEFVAPYSMGSSDCESFTLNELLAYSDPECLRLWDQLSLGYTETHGLPRLREAISTMYTEVPSNNVLVFSGAEEAIFIALQVLLKPNDHVVVFTPCYQSLKEIPKCLGANVSEVPLEWNHSRWNLNLNALETQVNANTKMIIINFPHNPTGFQPTQEEFQKIISIARLSNALIFSDEVYRLSEQDPNDTLPNAADCYEHAFSLGVMSKSFGLAGLRIGWLASQNHALLEEMASYKNYTSICNSAPSEILALMALRNREQILKRNREIARQNLDVLDTFFDDHKAIFEWYRPNAGFINFPRLKIDTDIESFSEQLIQEQGVIIIPGTFFDTPNNHFRLGFGRRNLTIALEKFAEFTTRSCVGAKQGD